MPNTLDGSGAATILVVDDDEAGSAAVREALRQLGHQTLHAGNWTEAVRLFGEHVDLVFMDAVMPDVDGFKLTRVLRERSRSYTPILFLTGLGDAAAKQRGRARGLRAAGPRRRARSATKSATRCSRSWASCCATAFVSKIGYFGSAVKSSR